jgi:hypothetical protein
MAGQGSTQSRAKVFSRCQDFLIDIHRIGQFMQPVPFSQTLARRLILFYLSLVSIAYMDLWRREWDSNPRYLAVNTLSKRAPSATRPSLRLRLCLSKSTRQRARKAYSEQSLRVPSANGFESDQLFLDQPIRITNSSMKAFTSCPSVLYSLFLPAAAAEFASPAHRRFRCF